MLDVKNCTVYPVIDWGDLDKNVVLELLKSARSILTSTDETFVCYAISNAGAHRADWCDGLEERAVSRKMIFEIGTQLAGGVDQVLAKEGLTNEWFDGSTMNSRGVLGWLIAQCDKEWYREVRELRSTVNLYDAYTVYDNKYGRGSGEMQAWRLRWMDDMISRLEN